MTTRELIEELKALPEGMLDREISIYEENTKTFWDIEPFNISTTRLLSGKEVAIFKIQI